MSSNMGGTNFTGPLKFALTPKGISGHPRYVSRRLLNLKIVLKLAIGESVMLVAVTEVLFSSFSVFQIFILTDGCAHDQSQCLNLIRNNPNKAR